MVRAILSAVIGYVCIVAIVMTSFTAAYLAMGTEQAFLPGTYDVSFRWIAISTGLGLIAAIAGGLVCALIARNRSGPRLLAAIVLILGMVMAVAVCLNAPLAKVRPADVSSMAAMQEAITPFWVALINPIIGATGVLAGARLARRGSA